MIQTSNRSTLRAISAAGTGLTSSGRLTRTRAARLLLVTLIAALFSVGADAGDCWVRSRALTRTSFGASAADPQYARLFRATERAEAFLRADARLNAIEGVRYQIDRTITMEDHPGGSLTASTHLRLHLPGVWKGDPGCNLDQGAADYMSRYSVSIEYNALAPILGALGATLDDGETPAAALHPAVAAAFASNGVILADADAGATSMRAVRLDGRPVIVPLTVDAHLTRWERLLVEMQATDELQALRAHRSQLASEALTRPAWVSPSALSDRIWGYAVGGAEGASPLYQVSRDLLEPNRDPGAILLVTVSVSAPSDDNDPISAALRGWIAELDDRQLASLANGAAR